MQTTILVGDIGSTKSTWWFRTTTDHEIHLKGYNPLAHTRQQAQELFTSLRAQTKEANISAIWYYGTGVISQQIEKDIFLQLSPLFENCPIHVHSDLVGAARAANRDQAGAVAILGTGSHAALWDGTKIIKQATSLGYILGDEGGGCDIGKSMIQAYFYKELPEEIHASMVKRLPDGRAGLLEKLNNSSSPNQYLAEFAAVATDFKVDPWIKALVADRFRLFIKRHVKPLQPDTSIHVVGSIGSIFAEVLTEELNLAGLSSGKFIQNPARQLYESHLLNE